MLRTADAVAANPWKQCLVCDQKIYFGSAGEFRKHLRTQHCSKEGGSYVCRYGKHGVCPSLPIEGVSDVDYEAHVEKCHIRLGGRGFTANATEKDNEKKIPPFQVTECKSWIGTSCQNLSAVQNDPRTYGRQSTFFIKTWGESFIPHEVVPLTLLPNIPKKYFENYLKKIEFKQMSHERLKRSSIQNSSPLHYHSGQTESDFGSDAARLVRRNDQDNMLEGEDSIPKMFMQQPFNLEDPAVFNSVIPWSCVEVSRERHKSRSSGSKRSAKLLQEKLTHFLDTTEVKLARQIALKSEDFFGAMSSQDKLQDEVHETCQDVQKLRGQVEDIRAKIVKSPYNIMRLFRMKTRYMVLYNKLKLMATIHQTQSTIQLLLATSGFVSALDLIAATQDVLEQELLGVQSFRHLGSQLSEMHNVIVRMMETDFVDTAIINLNAANETCERLAGLIDEDRLVSALRGLLQQRRFNFLQSYKDSAYGLIKSSIKQTFQSEVAQQAIEGESESNELREALRSLSHQAWLDLLRTTFDGALKILHQMKLIHDTILSIVMEYSKGLLSNQPERDTEMDQEKKTCLSSSECNQLKTESKELLWSACEMAQIRCSKIIGARCKDGTLDQLTSTEFVSLARLVEGFVSDCEEICGKQSHNLRGTLLSQAKKFVEKFHEERKHKLDLILENERWKQADVPVELQSLVDQICDGMDEGLTLPNITSKEKSPKKHLFVKKQQFAVVGTLLILLKMVVEYCQCVEDVPMLTTEIMAKLFEVMKIFNSRSCQLVLGAGALQLVGLQRITAKHLALVAQCLEVIIVLIPVFKLHFEMRLPPKHYVLLSQFDNILKDFGNHRQEILCKIVHLMEELFTDQLKHWEVRPPMPSAAMRGIVKQVLKLKDSLATVLSNDQLEVIFRDIKRAFKNCLAEKLFQLGVLNDGGPQQGLVMSDLAFFEDTLKSCPGLSDSRKTFSSIWTVVREKRKKVENVVKIKQ